MLYVIEYLNHKGEVKNYLIRICDFWIGESMYYSKRFLISALKWEDGAWHERDFDPNKIQQIKAWNGTEIPKNE